MFQKVINKRVKITSLHFRSNRSNYSENEDEYQVYHKTLETLKAGSLLVSHNLHIVPAINSQCGPK